VNEEGTRLDAIRANAAVGLYRETNDTIEYLLGVIDCMGQYIEDLLTPYPEDDDVWLHGQ
jgi:hypothetical protein